MVLLEGGLSVTQERIKIIEVYKFPYKAVILSMTPKTTLQGSPYMYVTFSMYSNTIFITAWYKTEASEQVSVTLSALLLVCTNQFTLLHISFLLTN